MNDIQEIQSLRKEVTSLKSEISDLKDFVKALYTMIMADDDGGYEESEYGGIGGGRFNT